MISNSWYGMYVCMYDGRHIHTEDDDELDSSNPEKGDGLEEEEALLLGRYVGFVGR